MGARASAAAATGERVLDAATEVFWEMPSDQISLEEVARRSGVSVQTVIRHFGGKDGLLAAASAREAGRVRAQRDEAPVGDTAAAIRVLVEHYENTADRGRAMHRDWCARVFSTALTDRVSVERRRRRLAQLVAVCDVYTWKLLRRDAGLSRRQTELALVELVQPLLEVP
jgi:AcrR family transcriptional regulator